MEIKRRLTWTNIIVPLSFVPTFLFPVGGRIKVMGGDFRWLMRNRLARRINIGD